MTLTSKKQPGEVLQPVKYLPLGAAGLAAGVLACFFIGYLQAFIDTARDGVVMSLGGEILALGDRYAPWVVALVVLVLVSGGAWLLRRLKATHRTAFVGGTAVGLLVAIGVGWTVVGSSSEPLLATNLSPAVLLDVGANSLATFLLLAFSIVRVAADLKAAKQSDQSSLDRSQ